MISTVTVLGLMAEQLKDHPEFRYIEVETVEVINETSYLSKIPVCYWDREVCNYLLRIPSGHFVVIFGRLESHPEVGVYILIEQIRHFQSNLTKHQKDRV